jgi:hypothetical protein
VCTKPWLKPALDKAGVAPDLQFRIEVAKLLIDRLNDLIAWFDDTANQVCYIDTCGVLLPARYVQRDTVGRIFPTLRGARDAARHC